MRIHQSPTRFRQLSGRALVVLGCALLVAACGKTILTTGAGAAATVNPVATEPLTTVGPYATTTAGATPAPNAPTPGGAMTPGALTLTLNAASFTAGAPITVTIHNGLSASVIVTDHRSNCSLVTLQQQINGAWVDLAPCKSMIATRAMELGAGSATATALGAGAQTSLSGWGAGTYRVALAYLPAPLGASGAGGTIYSATFTIA